ncbi:MAG: ABC transporter substrate-binding protein [Nanoarchaeota archaeon]|nr:ABC transporter substrate-binding protein [Nanoarchaeota archaeon]
MKKLTLLLITFAILFVTAVIYFEISSSRHDKDLIRIGYNAESLYHGPIMIANDKGIFERYGLKVELVPLKSAKETQQALAMGSINLGSAGVTNFFIAIANEAPVKVIAPMAASPTQLFVRPNEERKITDLSGKIIASQRGGASNLALGYALDRENVSLDGIKFVDIEKSVRPIALMDKRIVDAVAAGEYEERIYLDYGAVLLEEWETKGYSNKSFPRTVIAVNTNFMRNNKKATELFIDAFIESQKFIEENPGEAAVIIAKHMNDKSRGIIDLSKDDIMESWIKLKYTIWYDPQELVELSKIAKNIGDLKSNLDVDQIFDESFKDKLEDAQNEIYNTPR